MFLRVINAGQVYYLYVITSTTTRLTILPNDEDSLVDDIGEFIGEFTMAKLGSIALLPEPFYFNQSIVKYNNRIYVCAISNNDSEFIFGKWELLDNADRRLNAMDRVIGYYQPTNNMPGVDLSQLFEGVTYPNPTYKGNDFEPSEQFPVDTILDTIPFYPSEANITGIAYDGSKYLASTNLSGYSAVLTSVDTESWDINKLSNANINTTSIRYVGGVYLMTSTNMTTPLFRSMDGVNWTTTGYYLPSDSSYPLTLNVSQLSLNDVAYCPAGQAWIAVGAGIVRSTDTYMWENVATFDPILNYQLNAVTTISATNCQGLIAVGKGKEINTSTGIAVLDDINLFFYSPDSVNWNRITPVTDKGFYGLSSDGTRVLAVGERGVIYSTQNGFDWLGINEVNVVFVNSDTNIINVTNALGFCRWYNWLIDKI
jgi:hypothetical protein